MKINDNDISILKSVTMRTYTIDGCNEMFLTLQEAKKHIWLAYTPKECIKELTDTCIVGWKDGEVHSLTAIRVNKNGKVSYGRTVKY